MPFADIRQRQYSGDFKKVEFIKLSPGMNQIRILDSDAYSVDVHYVGGINVQCLGEDRPVCKNNKKIIFENPKEFRNIKGYAPRRQLFIVNVLDRSMVKICPNESCKEEVKAVNGMYPTQCPKCSALLHAVQPHKLDKVKILAKGVELFSSLNAFEVAINDVEGNPIGLTNFDIMLAVSGNKKESPTPIPNTSANDVIEIPAEQLFDREKVVLKFSPAEIADLQRGISLRDIFAARKAEKEADETVNDLRAETTADIQQQISNIFPS
jgi:hypothetical protein